MLVTVLVLGKAERVCAAKLSQVYAFWLFFFRSSGFAFPCLKLGG